MMWDVMGGVARRSWARNANSIAVSAEYNRGHVGKGHITLPMIPDEGLVEAAVRGCRV
jgi:urocanate hydratase